MTAALEVGSANWGSGETILLSSGQHFRLLDPDPELITPQVVAHSLAQTCRFVGHTTRHYSVAQHCVVVSKIVPHEIAMAGLMHDASEAFIGDVSRPLKIVLEAAAPGVLCEIEDRIHAAVAERYGFDFPHDPRVKQADNVALSTEKRDVMPPDALVTWKGLPEPLPYPIIPWPDWQAELFFFERYLSLGGAL